MDSDKATNIVKSACPYCGVGCGIVMEVSGNTVVKVSGDKEHPANFGRLCTKGSTCAQAINATGRMKNAHLRRSANGEQAPVDMQFAISETARRLREILNEHGPDAIAFYVSGQMSLEAQYLANKLAKGFIRTVNIESNSRLCMASAGSGYKLSLGSDGPPGSYEDFDKTDLFFVIGSNMADCHPVLFLRMMDRVKRGAKLIVVDPRRTATADKADLFLQIRPGTDLALLNGLLHLLLENGHIDTAFIEEFTDGWDRMPDFLGDYCPTSVADITGLSRNDLQQAARMIGEASRFMSCWTMGLNQSTHGTWATNAVCNLHLATGRICEPGSGPFSLTGQPNAMGGREMGYMGPGLPGQRSALVEAERRFIEDMWQLPCGAIRAEAGGGTIAMFEDMKAGKIKACWIICTNPVASVANRQNVIDALKSASLVIAQDAFFDTETNIYADILLPGALWAEGDGVMINSERNMTLAPKAVDPPGDALPDWMIIARVACEMGFESAFQYTSAAEIFDEIAKAWNPKTGYDIRGASHARLGDKPLQWPVSGHDATNRNPIRYLNDGISQTQMKRPDGTCPALAFPTQTGRAQFLPRPHLEPADMPGAEFPFVLNTGRLQHQWHTMTKTGKIPTLNKLNPGPLIEIHPEDAAVLGIRDKDRVEIRSRRGRAILPAVVTDRVRPGNCFAPFHWNDVFGDDLGINAVTSDAIDPISLQPEFKFSAVSLTLFEQAQPLRTQPKDTRTMNAAFTSASPEPAPLEIAALTALTGIGLAPALELAPHEKTYVQGYMTGLSSIIAACREETPVLPESAPLEASTRLMLNGMLAGLFSRQRRDLPAETLERPQRAPPAASAAAADKTITLLWASQTGNAETAALTSAKRLEEQGHKIRLLSMDAMGVGDLANGGTVVIFASTFGDGDPPDNGTGLWAQLNDQSTPQLSRLRYAIVAFGDSNYDQFCGFGRKLDTRLQLLGAHRLADRVECEPDDQEILQDWHDILIKELKKAASLPPQAPVQSSPMATLHNRKNPYGSRLALNRPLNAPGSAKDTRQLAFNLGESTLAYEAGDALGVWPRNCPALVDEILGTCSLDADTPVSVEGQADVPLHLALRTQVEITRPSLDFLRWWASQSQDETLVALLATEKKQVVTDWLWGKQIADIMALAPANVNAQELIANLKRLQPRLYSISSSPAKNPRQVELTVSAVRYDCGDKARKGSASTFLADRAAETDIPIFIQKSAHFRLPADPLIPIIMVGPGTGIAPFRAFLQEREATGARGRNWLFFGEQYRDRDFYYRDELEDWQKSGHLTRLDTAFSRDQAHKIYVQDRMVEQGQQLWRWLEEGAFFYVCGDAGRMASDVNRALQSVIRTHGHMTQDKALEYVASLSAAKRYLRDVY